MLLYGDEVKPGLPTSLLLSHVYYILIGCNFTKKNQGLKNVSSNPSTKNRIMFNVMQKLIGKYNSYLLICYTNKNVVRYLGITFSKVDIDICTKVSFCLIFYYCMSICALYKNGHEQYKCMWILISKREAT